MLIGHFFSTLKPDSFGNSMVFNDSWNSHNDHVFLTGNKNEIARYARFSSLRRVFVEHLDLLVMLKIRYKGYSL